MKLPFALAVAAVVSGLSGSGCGTQCPVIGFSEVDSGCEITATDCSDQVNYKATCIGLADEDPNGRGSGFECRCFREGISGVDDVFFSEDICSVRETDAALKLANIGCGWQVSDPT